VSGCWRVYAHLCTFIPSHFGFAVIQEQEIADSSIFLAASQDKQNRFQGGWALVAEQLPYAAGAAKSILLDRELGKERSACVVF
jgi:hypothetical protein